MEETMSVLNRTLFIFFLGVTAASAAELPQRKAGLWDLSIETAAGHTVSMKQCVDAKTDAALQAMGGAMSQRACSKRDIQRSGNTITIDSVCAIAGKTRTGHTVITGSFESAYTMVLTSQGGGMPTLTTTLTAKWTGPCAADQKPGDTIMANGMKMNILGLQNGLGHRMAPPAAPPNQ
jgi:hypothetical protein